MKKIFTFVFITTSTFVFAQEHKTYTTQKTAQNITIDGVLNETDWQKVPVATDFKNFTPDNGKPEPTDRKTEVKVLYDDTGVYIGAKMFQDSGTILQEIVQRDNVGAADFFGVFINGYNDGQQDFRFFVTAAGIQIDALATESNGEDYSWDAIWHSEVKITDFGWVVEMKIPYAALRFSDKENQTWGINFFRAHKKANEKYSWNHIDTNIGNLVSQTGVLEGIKNVKTPTRLFFIPYVSDYYTTNANGSTNKFKAGMDIKYGINDAFTLDAILVPDFGQTTYDDVELNLGPFEQQFSENRSFFTEGTDLFSKGDILYTRRIGGTPSLNASDLTNTNEVVNEEPAVINLLNATKISGRTSKGLGIGVLNAVTEKTEARLYNTANGTSRHVVTEPLANYNVLVFDQRFNGNSSVSLINTNVTRNGSFRDANVTGLVYDLNNEDNSYSLWGHLIYSTINDVKDYDGFKGYVALTKTSGKVRFGTRTAYYSKNYDINDLGFNFFTNYFYNQSDISYRILNPTEHFNVFNMSLNQYIAVDNKTLKFQDFNYNIQATFANRANDYYGGEVGFQPIKAYDFYEPRIEGRYSYKPKYAYLYSFFSTNYNRKFALDFNGNAGVSEEKNRCFYQYNISPRYRFSDKFLLVYDYSWKKDTNEKGYAYITDTKDVIFVNRNRTTIENTISGKYSFNNKMNLNLSVRHYHSFTKNHNFLKVENDASYSPSEFKDGYERNFNTWNFDLSYTWWFAPGSQLSVLYRNNNTTFQNELFSTKYTKNLSNTLRLNELNNIFSISLRYYLDYNDIKNHL